MASKKVLLIFVIALIAIGWFSAWYFQVLEPRRNAFGKASLEKLMMECDLAPSGLKIRLYRGEPNATSSFWYSVTAASKDDSEKQFFYTYSEPEISSIECKGSQLNVALSNAQKRAFDANEIAALRAHPKGINKGADTAH